jgi:gluconolactonase
MIGRHPASLDDRPAGDRIADGLRCHTGAMPTRSPSEPEYDVFDGRFRDLLVPGALLHHLADGCTWAEGPVHLAERAVVLWSDVSGDRRMRYDERTGDVAVADHPANFCNGHTLDLDGRVIACEHGSRSVVRLLDGGGRDVVADRFDGKRLNSPNDVVVARDGAIWFTDPPYGIDSDVEGHRAESEIGSNDVYRVDPGDGRVSAEVVDMVCPNGLAFSLDGSSLYVADTGVSHVVDGPRHIRRFDVAGGHVTGGGEVFATCPTGVFDGFRLDAVGRVWASGHQGVHCYEPDGRLIGTIRLPEVCANLVFGGPDRRWLYMTATTSLYRLELAVRGAA